MLCKRVWGWLEEPPRGPPGDHHQSASDKPRPPVTSRELSLRRPDSRKKQKKDGKDRGRDRGGKGSRSRSPRRPKAGRVDNRGGKAGPSGGHTFEGLPESAPHGHYGSKFEQTSVRVAQLLDQPRGESAWRITQVCKDATGNCKHGAKCSFAHSRDELGKFMYKDRLYGFR